MKRICLFAGINGHLGQNFRNLYADKYTIIGVGRSSRNYDDIDYVQGDILNEAEGIANYVFGRYNRVDLLVNATCKIDIRRFDKKNLGEMRDEIEQNVLAPMSLIHSFLYSKWGNSYSHYNKVNNTNIVNISSMAGSSVIKVGDRLVDSFGYSIYCGAKAFIDSFTMNVAQELANYNIRINAVAPSTFDQCVPTDEVSKIIEHLDQSTFTGQVMLLPSQYKVDCLQKPVATVN